jgi:D-3-phosphoglycerate dehydrogenase
MTRILVAEAQGFSPEAERILRDAGEVVLADLDRAGLIAALADVDVLWVRLRTRIDADVLAAAPRLRILATNTTGLTHVDLDACAARGVQVVCLRGETDFLKDIHATAEHTLALVLALLRRLPAAFRHVESGGWDRDPFRGGEIHGKTFGIVGYGRLGRLVGGLAAAFGARVLAFDPYVSEVGPGVEKVGLDELLAASDIVSLHVALTPETTGWFDAAKIARMRRGALLVNTARGEVLDEAAVLAALEGGHLGGGAFDVLTGERSSGMGHHPFVRLAREGGPVVVTPHIGGATWESTHKTEDFLAGKLRTLLRS